MARLYELHVFTFGSRLYAHTIAGERLMGFCPALDTQRLCVWVWLLSFSTADPADGGKVRGSACLSLAPAVVAKGQAVLQSLLSARWQSRSSPECKLPVPLSAACRRPLERLVRITAVGEVGALCEGCRPGHQGRLSQLDGQSADTVDSSQCECRVCDLGSCQRARFVGAQ